MNVNRTVEKTLWVDQQRRRPLNLHCISIISIESEAVTPINFNFAVTTGTPETRTLWYTPRAITITSVAAVATGATIPGVSWNIAHSESRNDVTPETVFSVDQDSLNPAGEVHSSGFNDATIPAARWIWLQVLTVNLDAERLSGSVDFTED